MNKSESIDKLATALNKFQGEVANILKTSENPYFKSKYAKLEDILNEYRLIWTKHGLSISQHPVTDEQGRIGVQTEVYHNSGEYRIFPPFYLTLTKNDPQGGGSAITYARRYSLAAVLGIQQEDDDGNSHVINPPRNKNYDNKPLDTEELSKAKDKFIAEIRPYNPTDNIILDIDNIASINNLNTYIVVFWQTKCKTGLAKLSKDKIDKFDVPTHYNSSIKKALGTTKVDGCKDVALLKKYTNHLLTKYYSHVIQQEVIRLDMQSDDPSMDAINEAVNNDNWLDLKQIYQTLKDTVV